MAEPIVDRAFAEKFLTAVDRPFDYGVYFLFHDWWAEATDEAIAAYERDVLAVPGAAEFMAERHLADPLTVERLAECAAGTLGAGLHQFIVGNNLQENLARNYRDFNEELSAAGTLDRLPADLCYMIVRGFQIHDTLHVLAGFDSSPMGELAQAGFHYAQLGFPYHAMRVAVTTAHVAFVAPQHIRDAMDAMVEGWVSGRRSDNLHFVHWEDELDTPLADLREQYSIPQERVLT